MMLKIFYDPERIPIRFRILFILIVGISFCFIGIATLVLTIVELFHGRAKEYHYDENQGGLKIENPLWPSSGKGFWVGLILLATGFVAILASRERTPSSCIGFIIMTCISTVLSFYMLITCIIPIRYDTTYSNTPRPQWQTAELTINSLLIAAGCFAVILGSTASCVGCCFVGWCTNQRDDPRYSDEPNRILIVTPNPINFANIPALRFGASPRLRMRGSIY